ncbi:MAG: hypothetical protein ABSE06_01430 [Anaerolineaceae bacterium]
MPKSRWGTTPVSKTEIHVHPLEDLVVHILTEDCGCHPQIDIVEGAGRVIVHNSWDGREVYEYFEATKGIVQ